jgi:L-ascorbate metabolism protein UlaG (beta-lactamase superfamily)
MNLELTWFGHACWMLDTGIHRIIIDPFLSENPSAKIKSSDVNADFVLLTHGHFDHIADAAEITNRCDALLIANYEIASWFTEKHQVKRTLGMNLGGTAVLPFGRIKMTVAFHSSQLPDGSYGGNPGGYLIELAGKRIYFAGDTALFSDMALIKDGGLDLAILPIGDLFTMGPEDSISATKLLSPKRVLPSHYNTWPPIAQDAQLWAQHIRECTNSEPVVLQVGQAVAL